MLNHIANIITNKDMKRSEETLTVRVFQFGTICLLLVP